MRNIAILCIFRFYYWASKRSAERDWVISLFSPLFLPLLAIAPEANVYEFSGRYSAVKTPLD